MKAKFEIHRNDMYWDKYLLETTTNGYEWFKLEWQGYNDSYWWDNVSPNQRRKEFVGDKGTKKVFEIDFHTCEITEVEE